MFSPSSADRDHRGLDEAAIAPRSAGQNQFAAIGKLAQRSAGAFTARRPNEQMQDAG
jgi:hypothetical protein